MGIGTPVLKLWAREALEVGRIDQNKMAAPMCKSMMTQQDRCILGVICMLALGFEIMGLRVLHLANDKPALGEQCIKGYTLL